MEVPGWCPVIVGSRGQRPLGSGSESIGLLYSCARLADEELCPLTRRTIRISKHPGRSTVDSVVALALALTVRMLAILLEVLCLIVRRS